MSNNIDLKKGLNIPIRGAAALALKKTIAPDVVAVKPTDFKGFSPRLLVKEGDAVKAGSPVMADKRNADILLCAPVSGTVQSIVRGEKRKLLALVVKADGQNTCVDFGAEDPTGLDAGAIKEAILNCGLWPSIVERPYGIVADPNGKPKAIFVSAFNTAPLAADPDFAFSDDFEAIQAGITAVSKLSEGGVHVCVNRADSPFCKLQDATIHLVNGDKHPAGNVEFKSAIFPPSGRRNRLDTFPAVPLRDRQAFYRRKTESFQKDRHYRPGGHRACLCERDRRNIDDVPRGFLQSG